MTILSVVKQVCAVVGVTVPPAVFANIGANRTMQEMVECANECAQRIAYDTREWTKLKKSVIYVGDGVKTAWEIPFDYRRMLLTSNVWRSTSSQQPMMHIDDTDEWTQRRAAGTVDAWGEWTLLGDHMHIYPPLAAAVTATYVYLDRNCVLLGGPGGGFGDQFMQDVDTFRLDERVLKLCMIADWKMKKGSPYAEDLGTYSDALANVSGADKHSPILVDRASVSQFARVSGSWPAIWGP